MDLPLHSLTSFGSSTSTTHLLTNRNQIPTNYFSPYLADHGSTLNSENDRLKMRILFPGQQLGNSVKMHHSNNNILRMSNIEYNNMPNRETENSNSKDEFIAKLEAMLK